MVMRLSNRMGLKTLFMKEGVAAEGTTESLKEAAPPENNFASAQVDPLLARSASGSSKEFTWCLTSSHNQQLQVPGVWLPVTGAKNQERRLPDSVD